MNLNNTTGVLRGTASETGSFSFTIEASFEGESDQQAYSINVVSLQPIVLGPALAEVAMLMATAPAFATSIPWSQASLFSLTEVTGAKNLLDGQDNTAAAASAEPGGAADYCQNLVAHGFDDWYLPAATETVKLRALNPMTGSVTRWSSTDESRFFAYVDNTLLTGPGVTGGTSSNILKTTSSTAHCIRSFVPEIAESDPDPCDTTTTAGTICKDGSVYTTTFSGNRLFVTDPLHEAAFSQMNTNGGMMPSGLTANDGLTNTQILVADSRDLQQADYCANLVAHGHSDWYLPSMGEMNALAAPFNGPNEWINGMAAFKIGFGNNYWTSSDDGSAFFPQPAATGITVTTQSTGMGAGDLVRCMRRG